MPWSSVQSKPKPIKKKPRKKSETLRIYGPPPRREFVKSLPCAACGVVGYSENAHLLGNGGMSRKADADTIGPLCAMRPNQMHDGLYMGCHNLFDEWRSIFNTRHPDFDAGKVAAETQKLWEAANV